MRAIALGVWIALTAALLGPVARAETAAEVPVRRVVLFTSGVGYFEHSGQVEGEATATLHFKTAQINDVLKSMVLLDYDGGAVQSVNYASRDPLTRALKSFALDLSDNPDMAALLGQLRGARLVVFSPRETAGTVVGVETRTREVIAGGKTTILTETVLNLLTEDGLVAIPTTTIRSLSLDDEHLAGELDKALAMLRTATDTQRKAVDIRFSGTGERRVAIGYVVESPVWKASYRLVFADDKPLLQGWAIVENTSDADWADVQLELVSGRPISFIQDLYTPLYLPRPIVRPKMYASLRPRVYEEGMDAEAELKAAAPPRVMSGAGTRGRAEGRVMAADAMGAPAARMAGGGFFNEAVEQTSRSVASAGEVGDLFRYAIDKPVTLSRRQSAMLPIVSGPINAEAVSIYNRSVQPRRPLNGAILTNDTDLLLLGGPMTVFDDGAYAGDARIDNLAPGDKRLISYAVDLKLLVDAKNRHSQRITSASIVRGTLRLKRRQHFQQDYIAASTATEDRTLIVEHPRDTQRTLLSPKEPEEIAGNLYRFRLTVPAGEKATLTVEEERVFSESIGLLGRDVGFLRNYTRSGEIPQAVRDAIAPAIEMSQKIAAIDVQLNELAKRRETVGVDQDRLRKNLASVGATSPLGQRYLDKLNQQEDALEALDAEVAEAQASRKSLQDALAKYLNELTVG